ncbi:immunity 8 family protein [Thorsellia anophelis]|uniref:Immunity protein 8 n=1 Tax=Thorsellia anophelis DSM 18579 TaxID=1123402 RepID=A0A1I0EP61_9GAMM|nr:immunity 8 family protein [Thorsellia anophelis]SET47229.1 Immunity protein 8 [Thorsellia anophelis DSM 18579]
MKAKLKSLGVTSAQFTPETYQPNKISCFGLWFRLCVGPEDQIGGHDFHVLICTPEWLCKNHWEPELIQHMLLVRKYDLDEITETINKCIENCTCDTWIETAQKLSRYFAWEYEDYQP